jgi:hypothetical protein
VKAFVSGELTRSPSHQFVVGRRLRRMTGAASSLEVDGMDSSIAAERDEEPFDRAKSEREVERKGRLREEEGMVGRREDDEEG